MFLTSICYRYLFLLCWQKTIILRTVYCRLNWKNDYLIVVTHSLSLLQNIYELGSVTEINIVKIQLAYEF